MADEEQLYILQQGVDAWNEWREEHPYVKVELSGALLNRMHLNDANFSEGNLFKADLSEAGKPLQGES
jgi:hypothetical protein